MSEKVMNLTEFNTFFQKTIKKGVVFKSSYSLQSQILLKTESATGAFVETLLNFSDLLLFRRSVNSSFSKVDVMRKNISSY